MLPKEIEEGIHKLRSKGKGLGNEVAQISLGQLGEVNVTIVQNPYSNFIFPGPLSSSQFHEMLDEMGYNGPRVIE